MPIHLRRLIWQKAATTQKNVHSAKKKYLKKQKNVLNVKQICVHGLPDILF